MSVQSICINDKNMPVDFRNKSKWVKKDQKYTIINILYVVQSKTLGFQLAEIDLSDNFPYTFFNANRFAIPADQLELFLELMQKCKDDLQNDDDISEFEELLKTVETTKTKKRELTEQD